MRTEQFQEILNRIEAGEFDISVLCFGEKGGKKPSVIRGIDEDKLKSTFSLRNIKMKILCFQIVEFGMRWRLRLSIWVVLKILAIKGLK